LKNAYLTLQGAFKRGRRRRRRKEESTSKTSEMIVPWHYTLKVGKDEPSIGINHPEQ
jgi:hypothetical protein